MISNSDNTLDINWKVHTIYVKDVRVCFSYKLQEQFIEKEHLFCFDYQKINSHYQNFVTLKHGRFNSFKTNHHISSQC